MTFAPPLLGLSFVLFAAAANTGDYTSCPGSDTAGEAAPQNLVPAARSDSRSGPEGGSVNAGEPRSCEPPQSGPAPQAVVAEAPIQAGGDYEFTARWPNGETLHVCAKPPIVHGHVTLDPCADAMRGLWQPLGAPPIGEAELSYRSAPGCFDPASLEIRGRR